MRSPIAPHTSQVTGPVQVRKTSGTGTGSHGRSSNEERNSRRPVRAWTRATVTDATATSTNTASSQTGGSAPVRCPPASTTVSTPSDSQAAVPAQTAAASTIPAGWPWRECGRPGWLCGGGLGAMLRPRRLLRRHSRAYQSPVGGAGTAAPGVRVYPLIMAPTLPPSPGTSAGFGAPGSPSPNVGVLRCLDSARPQVSLPRFPVRRETARVAAAIAAIAAVVTWPLLRQGVVGAAGRSRRPGAEHLPPRLGRGPHAVRLPRRVDRADSTSR